jgi:cob(I)alamin adenosyltransferase
MSADRAETPVVLSRIYTRTGDDGSTALGDGSRAAKTDPRLAAYADVDEANCAIGVAVTMGSLPGDVRELLIRIQNELFDVGADLCNPITPSPAYPPLRVAASYIAALERACDRYNENLPTLRSFVLPGGSPGAALLHTARAVVRRAERTTWAAIAEHPQTTSTLTAQYLNRLSDLLFILARYVNEPQGDLLWKPGSDR